MFCYLTLNIKKPVLAVYNNNYRYSDSVQRFAMALYVLGGKITYEFVRVNLSGALPNLIALKNYVSNADLKLIEGDFRFNSLQQHLNSINTKYGFGSEDCTGVIRKIKYNKGTNTFIGFCTPLTNGIPTVKHFQTEPLEQLKTWFSRIEKAPLLNIYMFQPVVQSMDQSSPFLISVYGVNNQYTSIDIIQRWSYIYEEYNNKDPIHVATKWRNKMLSKAAQMIMGQQTVSLQHLAEYYY
ncbi:unnamed protein product [Didymodactylos carnosus]|uniref:Uncharacterized protein n=1 Tax=Didymodactylos carnosus TaxID=1234261 RepID=A0A814P0H1_9BILA|nr:unnamed protein product [Didymodactylos carnosus]CAF3865977.1 unnamed protein product [Didymodactylos carnosus]